MADICVSIYGINTAVYKNNTQNSNKMWNHRLSGRQRYNTKTCNFPVKCTVYVRCVGKPSKYEILLLLKVHVQFVRYTLHCPTLQ